MTRLITGLTTTALALLWTNFVHAGAKETPVKITHVVGKADSSGKQKVTITLAIDEGWHVYANPVGDEYYSPNAIVVKAKGAKAKVTYPPAKEKTESDGEKLRTFNVYVKGAQIVAEIIREGTDPVEFTVQYNACDKNRCLPPARVKFKID